MRKNGAKKHWGGGGGKLKVEKKKGKMGGGRNLEKNSLGGFEPGTFFIWKLNFFFPSSGTTFQKCV